MQNNSALQGLKEDCVVPNFNQIIYLVYYHQRWCHVLYVHKKN